MNATTLPTALVPAVAIQLTRAEGRHEECITVHLTGPHVWRDSTRTLLAWSRTAPAEGGYDKCDFTVTYQDGETYTGRYDLVHHTREFPSLAQHMRQFLEAYALRRIPSRYLADPKLEARWRQHVTEECKETHEAAGRFLDHYEIGGVP